MRNQMYAALLVMILHAAAPAQPARQNPLKINGQVLDGAGRPVSGALVHARVGALRGRLPSAFSDARGMFTLAVSQTGAFELTASKTAEGYPSSHNPFYYRPEDISNKVFVNENQAAPFVTIRFGSKAGRLAGQVLDAETNLPIRDVWIGLCRVEVPRYCHRLTAESADGRFQQLVPSVPFTIQISAPGYEEWHGDEGEGRRPEPMQVASGATRQINVSLQRSSARGDGKSGRPLLEAPRALSPAADAELDHFPRVTRVEWSAVPRAASYTVEVEFCMPGGADRKECASTHPLEYSLAPPQSGIEGTSYEFLFLGGQPGRWRVWAVDAQGRAGAKSPWSKFVYTQ